MDRRGQDRSYIDNLSESGARRSVLRERITIQMLFETDVRAAFGVITQLMNSSARRSGEYEMLDDPATLDTIVADNALSYAPERTRAEDVEIRLLRSRLEEFLRHDDEQQRLDLVNALLISAGSTPQLATHEGDEAPHFHYTMDDASFSSKLTALTAIGLARLLTTRETDRFRTCDGDGCDKVFIDVSKNASRRYCDSQTCGNRLHAARYRARRQKVETAAAGD